MFHHAALQVSNYQILNSIKTCYIRAKLMVNTPLRKPQRAIDTQTPAQYFRSLVTIAKQGATDDHQFEAVRKAEQALSRLLDAECHAVD